MSVPSPLLYGEFAPAVRSVTAFVFAGALMWAVRPSFAFTSDGEPRPWVHTPPNVAGKSTAWPWWTVPIGAALIAGVLI